MKTLLEEEEGDGEGEGERDGEGVGEGEGEEEEEEGEEGETHRDIKVVHAGDHELAPAMNANTTQQQKPMNCGIISESLLDLLQQLETNRQPSAQSFGKV